MRKPCAQCGATIPPQQGSARPRKFCVKCRPPRKGSNPRVVQLGDEPPLEELPPLVASYRKQLETAERADTPEGLHVLHLAALFASGQHTAAGAASLSKELRAAMEFALRGAPRAADALDELSARRTQKAAGA